MNQDQPPFESEAPRHFPGPLAALGLTFGAAFLSAVAMSIFGTTPNYGTIGLGQVMGYGLVAILATQRIPQPHSIRLGLRGFDRELIPMLVLLLPAVFLISECDNIIRDLAPPPPPDFDPESISFDLDSETAYGMLQRVIFIVGLAPVMEEWLFRGVIQQGLAGTLGRIPGVILTSLLFALGHVGFGLPPGTLLSFFIGAFTLGILLGCVRIATGSLLAAMLLHAAFSAIGIVAGFFSETMPIQGFTTPDTHTSFEVMAPSVVAVGFALVMLRRALEDAPPEPPIDFAEDSLEESE
jgi:membrane protease YdiL (CAAX protease family)